MNDQTPITNGAHHVGLTIPNLDATLAFFINTLKFKKVGEITAYPAVFISDGHIMITLWQAKDPANASAFDRHQQIGLHHLALSVNGLTVLNELHQQLQSATNVEIEFAPEPLGEGPTQHMMCYIPGGIRVEFIAPASAE